MKLDNSLEPFRAAVESLQRLLEEFNDQGVIIGELQSASWANHALRPMSMLYSCYL